MKEIYDFLSHLQEHNVSQLRQEDFSALESKHMRDLSTYIAQGDVEDLFQEWQYIISRDYLELNHPEENELRTRAVGFARMGPVNFVLFCDGEYQNPWLMCQGPNFIDVIITRSALYTISRYYFSQPAGIKRHVGKLNEIINLETYDQAIFRGFVLGHPGPYHFFYDQLKYALVAKDMNCNKEFLFDKAYLVPKNMSSYKKNGVYISPSLIGNNRKILSKSPLLRDINERMEEFVYTVSLNAKEKGKRSISRDNNSRVRIWYGITGSKRRWAQQEEACIIIASILSRYFDEVEFLIDGMTAREEEAGEYPEDEEIFNRIADACQKLCKVESIIGKDYKEKVRACNEVDLFIANSGTGGMVPLCFCKKPGVVHGSTRLDTFPELYGPMVKRTSKKITYDFPEDKDKQPPLCSYHVPWQHVFNLAAHVINAIKGTSITTLSVPQPGLSHLTLSKAGS